MTAIPTARQLEYQDWEFGIFIHFGIRTFYEGHKDWDGKAMSPDQFLPTRLDCKQWAATAKAAGAKYMVLTAKHHDGFANWPSKYTDFSVANSSWKHGQGDVVKEYVEACRLYDLKVGLYYSPADWKNPDYSNPAAYDDYFINQISELLIPYGKIDILWFDGCGSNNHEYDWTRICGEIRRMQPDILIFSMGDPDFRWVGNELGLAPVPCWNTEVITENETATAKWLPAECDCRMRKVNWFYCDADADTVKTPEELMGIYYYSVGRGANMLLNIGPDRRGLLPDKDTQNLLEWARERNRRFAKVLAAKDNFVQEGNVWTLKLPERTLASHVIIQENLADGEHVRKFHIECNPNDDNVWIQLWQGRNMGHKAICQFPLIALNTIRIVIDEADGTPDIRSISLI